MAISPLFATKTFFISILKRSINMNY